MRPKEHLYDLIKSLSKTEKRYFKIYCASQNGNKNYLKLFNEIDKQAASGNHYNESIIREKLKEEKFVRQLSFTKAYLKDLIQKSLSRQYQESDIDMGLNELVKQCKVLYNKCLWHQFHALVEQTKKLAYKHERFSIILTLIEIEKAAPIEDFFPGRNDNVLLQEESKVIEMIKNLHEYNRLAQIVQLEASKIGRKRGDELDEFIKKIEKNPLLSSPDRALSIRAKEKYWITKYQLRFIKFDLIGNLSYIQKCYDLIESNPFPFEGFSSNYWYEIVMSLISLTLRTEDHSRIESYLQSAKQHSTNFDIDRIGYIKLETLVRLWTAAQQKDWGKTDLLIQNAEKVIKKYHDRIDRLFLGRVYYRIIKLLLLQERYLESLKYVNICLNNPDYFPTREDVVANIRILNIIIHYEINNTDLLYHLLKSTYRYLRSRKRLYTFEELLLKFIKQLPKMSKNEDLAANLRYLKCEMIKLKHEPEITGILMNFDYIEWIDRKIQQLA
jgi:hypothetical protein